MAYLNVERGYIRFKIVYYGPALSGKSTNIEYLHRLTEGKVELKAIPSEDDTNAFIDFMSLNLGNLRGTETIYNLYSAPGQQQFARTRQSILKDVDGIILVIDSQAQALEDNIACIQDLEWDLAHQGIQVNELPIVIQYNKRDLPNVLPVSKLQGSLNNHDWPHLESSAASGENVKECLTSISQLVYQEATRRYSLIPSRIPPTEEVRDREVRDKEVSNEAAPEEQQASPANETTSNVPELFERETTEPSTPAKKDSGGLLGAIGEEFEEEFRDPTVPMDGLAQGVAEHLIKSIHPEEPAAATVRTTAPPAAMPTVLTDLYRVISDLKDQLLGRLDQMDQTLQQLVAQQNATDRAQEETREAINGLSAKFSGFEHMIEGLKSAVEQAIRQNIDGQLADYIKELGDNQSVPPSPDG